MKISQIGTFNLLVLSLFAFLGILFIPFSYGLIPQHEALVSMLFQETIHGLNTLIFTGEFYPQISSDSVSLYSLIIILGLISLGLGILWIHYFPEKISRFINWVTRFGIPFYLSIHLLRYGIDKLTMRQFYTPDAQTLFTPLGEISKDLLFWTTMGISPVYCTFMGVTQILTALFIWMERTRFIGLCLCMGIFIQIVALNFSYDISVKVFSLFLLFISVLGLYPYRKLLLTFFQALPPLKVPSPSHRWVYKGIKALLVLLVLWELSASNRLMLSPQQDSDALPGAYARIAQESENHLPINVKRIFIHREGYLIMEEDLGDRHRFEMWPLGSSRFLLKKKGEASWEVKIEYIEPNLRVSFLHGETLYSSVFEAISLEELPIHQSDFHWTLEGID